MRVKGMNLEGDDIVKTVALPMGEGATGRERIRAAGVTLTQLGDRVSITNVRFGSRARKLGLDAGYDVVELDLPNPARPDNAWGLLPAAPLLLLVWGLQSQRMRRGQAAATASQARRRG